MQKRKKKPLDILLVEERIVSARFSNRLSRVYLHRRFTMRAATDPRVHCLSSLYVHILVPH